MKKNISKSDILILEMGKLIADLRKAGWPEITHIQKKINDLHLKMEKHAKTLDN